MLSPADSAVVARDPAVPGLGVLLDTEAFLARLRRARPAADLRAAVPIYLRYKPGTGCMAGFRLDVAGAAVEVYARTLRAGDEGKLLKLARAGELGGALGSGHLLLDDCGVLVFVFPNDADLDALRLLHDPPEWNRLLRKMMPGYAGGWGDVRTLAYKPERRYVGQVRADGGTGGPVAAVKFYTAHGYEVATRTAKVIGSGGALRVPARLGRSARRQVVLLEWLAGHQLYLALAAPGDDAAPAAALAATARAGEALAELAARPPHKLRRRTHRHETESLAEVARNVGVLWPPLAERARALAERVAAELDRLDPIYRPIHGDFHAKQVLFGGSDDENGPSRVALVDLDAAVAGDPASDLGNFIAHLERHAASGDLPAARARAAAEALCDAYQVAARDPAEPRIRIRAAAQLLRVAPHAFRGRDPEWPTSMTAILDRAVGLLDDTGRTRTQSHRGRPAPAGSVDISDPCSAAADPKMPFVRAALDPQEVEPRLREALGRAGFPGVPRLRAVRTIRLKPGRRCLIEYDVEDLDVPGTAGVVTLIGKVRAKGLDRDSYRLLETLWRGAFGDDSGDGISVPRPAGVVPELHMTLQLKSPGVSAGTLLDGPAGVPIARRVADAAHKLHTAGVPASPGCRHTIDDELRVLHDRLSLVARDRPDWATRIDRLLLACNRLADAIPSPSRTVGVHRDFYPNQILVNMSRAGEPGRLYLLDLDLYSEGDEALDVGNFVAHMTEHALRTTDNPLALADRERALVDRFVELAGGGERMRTAVAGYALLTLARHVHIATTFPDRRAVTEPLLELCEMRLRCTDPSQAIMLQYRP